MMTFEEILNLGRQLTLFLRMFADCFASVAGKRLLRVYVQGQLREDQRKNCESIALKAKEAPRTVQRFLESIKWDEEKLHDRYLQVLARDHAHPDAIGTVDESGTAKSGSCTTGAARQYNGNRGKIENCIVGVHLGYSFPGFQTIMGSRQYLPESWANDPKLREKNYIPEEIKFQTKQQIAMDMIDRTLAQGIRVSAWTFDELYGRDSKFLDGLDDREQAFVGEIPSDMHGWTSKPRVIRKPSTTRKKGRRKSTPRVRRRPASCQVRNLVTYSSVFTGKSWQRYRIKDTARGPEVWEVKWAPFWRKTKDKLPSRKHTLIVARNVLTGEIKYFLSNKVVGVGGVTLRWLLRVAFGRWNIEACFRVAKEELGLDHFEVRGWRCIHRHYYVTALSYLFCNRVRKNIDQDNTGALTVEQVRRSVNAYLTYIARQEPAEVIEHEQMVQRYYQRRNDQAKRSHTKTRIERYRELGIDVEGIKSCIPRPEIQQTPCFAA